MSWLRTASADLLLAMLYSPDASLAERIASGQLLALAGDPRVRAQQPAMVTVAGGVVGIAFGAGLGWLVSVIASSAHLAWTFSVPIYAIVLAFGVSAAIGIFFGVFPARTAAKLDPIEALRYE